MTAVVVPAGQKNADLAAKQAEITTLAAVSSTAPHYNFAQQQLFAHRKNFVMSLLDRHAIAGGPAAVLSTVSYKGSVPELAAITALKASIASNTTTNPQLATNQARDLEVLQTQAIVSLMNAGGMDPAAVLAAFNFTGAN